MTRRDLLFAAVAAPVALPAQADANRQFVELANDYITRFTEATPVFATFLGEHRYDDRLSDVTPAGRQRTLQMQREFLRRLIAISPDWLSGPNRIDHQILRSHLESAIWSATVLRQFERNPLPYNPGNAIYLLLEREFAPLPERLKSVRARLQAIPDFLAAGKENLKFATKIHTETAILQNKGTINLLQNVLGSFLEKVPQMKSDLAPAQTKAIAALEDWGQWLAKDLLPKADADPRIGAELFREKLRYTLDSELSPGEIRQRAERDLKQTQAILYEVATGLSRKLFPGKSDLSDRKQVIRTVLDKLAERRPEVDTIVGQAKHELADATEFVRRQNLVTLYETPLRVIEMPEFQRGVAVASCSPPGPFEKNGVTFYNISPPPAQWTSVQVDSYFKEYNYYMLKNLTVHEAMPGHYLQRAHANRFQAPTLVRSVFSSGTFTEGWAVYAERIMVEHGYGGPEVHMQQLKMRLRTIVNALLDQAIHTEGMSEQQAMDLMMNEGFQERSEAAGKWRRALLTSTQLSTYFVGTTEIDKLREDYRSKHGEIKEWKAFHDKILSFGSPAPRYVRELMGV
jgi:uncharacterized protein (DUF885 family)